MGRMLIVLGILFLVAGIWISMGWKVPLRLGRLPGDIYINRGHTVFYFPIVTCIILSIVFTLVASLFRR